jgi:nucleoid-associated protein YgaU
MNIDAEFHAPPIINFVWGGLIFTSVLSRVSRRFTMFNNSGVPVRATLNVTFSKYSTEITPKHSPDRTRFYTIQDGDSLWSIAAMMYGDPALWRPIADKNKIEDPKFLENGKRVIIPPLGGD